MDDQELRRRAEVRRLLEHAEKAKQAARLQIERARNILEDAQPDEDAPTQKPTGTTDAP